MTLKSNRRWMRTALQGAAAPQVAMPWQRGPRRAEMLARRKLAMAAGAAKRAAVAAC